VNLGPFLTAEAMAAEFGGHVNRVHSLADNKWLKDLGVFSNEAAGKSLVSKFKNFKLKLMNVVGFSNQRLEEHMKVMDGRADILESVDMLVDAEKMSRELYAVLIMKFAGRLLDIVVETDSDKNGVEAWRNVCWDIEPKIKGRKLDMRTAIMGFELQENLSSFEDQLVQFDKLIADYKKKTGKEIDEDDKISILLRQSPIKLREHSSCRMMMFPMQT
jgi:hypothetical protein